MASRRSDYLPVDWDDNSNSNNRLLEPPPVARSGSVSSTSLPGSTTNKPRKFMSFWTFSLIILGIAVMFLLGVCVGFYVRELQKGDPDFDEVCGSQERKKIDFDVLGTYHEMLVYYIRGEEIKKFVSEFGAEDPVTGSGLEQRLADVTLQEFENYRFDSVEVEEHEVVVTSADPSRPNQLVVLHPNGTTLHRFALTNPATPTPSTSAVEATEQTGEITTEGWTFPHVAFSPRGEVSAGFVYGHFGRETDFQVLQTLQVETRDKIVLLRMGKLSVAEQVYNAEQHGVKGVLLYWDPHDRNSSVEGPANPGIIPFASAAMYSLELPSMWTPAIPCQTISSDLAETLMSVLVQGGGGVDSPSHWGSSFADDFPLDSADTELRLSLYNVESTKTIRNIVSTIQGIEEPDRYVIVGAPRSSLPGQSLDAVASTSILTQLARSFHYVHNLHYWKPRRGVKLVSWGGAEFSNAGIINHMRNHHHLIARRAVAYVDLQQLLLGNESIVARVPPSLYQLVKEATFEVPDPMNPELTLQNSWQEQLEKDNTSGSNHYIPWNGYHNDSTQNPFLHGLGVPTLKIQYEGLLGGQARMMSALSEDRKHHYKFHIAVTRILVMSLMSLLDNQVLPINLPNGARDMQTAVWQTSGVLEQCSDDMENLDRALNLCGDLVRASDAFQEVTSIFVKRADLEGIRMINDIKMLFERLFVVQKNGRPHHIMYPILADGSVALATDLCELGQLTEVWNSTDHFGKQLEAVLKEAVSSLHISA